MTVRRREHFTPGGLSRPHGAWSYPHPIPLARPIRNRVAFAPDIEVVERSGDRNGL